MSTPPKARRADRYIMTCVGENHVCSDSHSEPCTLAELEEYIQSDKELAGSKRLEMPALVVG